MVCCWGILVAGFCVWFFEVSVLQSFEFVIHFSYLLLQLWFFSDLSLNLFFVLILNHLLSFVEIFFLYLEFSFEFSLETWMVGSFYFL